MLLGIFLILISLLGNFVNSAVIEKPVSRWASNTKYSRNCYEALITPTESNTYLIQVDTYGPNPFLVVCDPSYGGGWTVIQRRQNNAIDFYRGWQDYKFGFGDWMDGFWLGLDKIHALTSDALCELFIVLEAFDGEIATVKYDVFAIGDENEGYALKLLGKADGPAGDSLDFQRAHKFATYDKDFNNCATERKGAWWYSKCAQSNLNGSYGNRLTSDSIYNYWLEFRGYDALKSSKMMIRPKL